MHEQNLLFDQAFLAGDTASGEVDRTVSDSIPMTGSRVVIAAMLIASVSLDATNKLVFLLEGTYDGKTWICPVASNKIEFTSNAPNSSASSALSGIDYSAVRLRATINGAAAKALFNGSIAISE